MAGESNANILDYVYFIVLLLTCVVLFRYAFVNIDNWAGRRYTYTVSTRLLEGYHHVDFSVVVMSVFAIGIKREY